MHIANGSVQRRCRRGIRQVGFGRVLVAGWAWSKLGRSHGARVLDQPPRQGMGHSNALSLIPSNRNEFHGTDCVAGQDGASDLWVCAQRLGHGYGASLEREFAGSVREESRGQEE